VINAKDGIIVDEGRVICGKRQRDADAQIEMISRSRSTRQYEVPSLFVLEFALAGR
jgi:hypothetical protein